MTTLKQFKEMLNNRLINVSKNLNKWEKMGIAAKLKIDTLTITKYTSGKIEQMASVVIGLYRADYYAYEEAKETGNPNVEFDNTIEYIFLKNRDGQTATHEMFIDVATSKIKEHNFVGNKF